jgi:hypothetical protein
LARHYRLNDEFLGRRWHFRSGFMSRRAFIGVAHYQACLTLGADSDGLFLSTPFLLGPPGHPPLFVPWSEIDATTYGFSFFSIVRLRFQPEHSVSLTLTRRLATRLATESHGHFSV